MSRHFFPKKYFTAGERQWHSVAYLGPVRSSSNGVHMYLEKNAFFDKRPSGPFLTHVQAIREMSCFLSAMVSQSVSCSYFTVQRRHPLGIWNRCLICWLLSSETASLWGAVVNTDRAKDQANLLTSPHFCKSASSVLHVCFSVRRDRVTVGELGLWSNKMISWKQSDVERKERKGRCQRFRVKDMTSNFSGWDEHFFFYHTYILTYLCSHFVKKYITIMRNTERSLCISVCLSFALLLDISSTLCGAECELLRSTGQVY